MDERGAVSWAGAPVEDLERSSGGPGGPPSRVSAPDGVVPRRRLRLSCRDTRIVGRQVALPLLIALCPDREGAGVEAHPRPRGGSCCSYRCGRLGDVSEGSCVLEAVLPLAGDPFLFFTPWTTRRLRVFRISIAGGGRRVNKSWLRPDR